MKEEQPMGEPLQQQPQTRAAAHREEPAVGQEGRRLLLSVGTFAGEIHP